jgi:hypothetical protein
VVLFWGYMVVRWGGFRFPWPYDTLLLGPVPVGDRDYSIGSNFWKLYLIRTDFTLVELVSLVKVFRLFRLERSFLVFGECGHSR